MVYYSLYVEGRGSKNTNPWVISKLSENGHELKRNEFYIYRKDNRTPAMIYAKSLYEKGNRVYWGLTKLSVFHKQDGKTVIKRYKH